MRKLLPYEHQLIEALDITEEEYWQFCLTRDKYADVKVGTIYDIRNEPLSTIALVLSIVGTIAQVAAALLAPRPDVPSAANARRSRNTAFAPRYGFNSFQEVARYGDPVNLVYTNTKDNSAGGLRVNTSLVWSAVQSFGTSQFIQMLAVVGAGDIELFDYQKTAFGQAVLEDFATQRYWLYAKEQSGLLAFGDLKKGDGVRDPSYDGQGANGYVYQVKIAGRQAEEGFSQAFSPSANNTLGLYGVVPINVRVIERNEKGYVDKGGKDDLGVYITESQRSIYWPNDWIAVIGDRPLFPAEREIEIVFKEDDEKIDADAEYAALDYRTALVSTIDSASLYKIGAAKFQLVNAQGANALKGPARKRAKISAGIYTFKCIEPGVLCEEDYDIRNYQAKEDDLNSDLTILNDRLAALTIEGEALKTDYQYKGPGAELIEQYDQELERISDFLTASDAILKGDISRQSLYDVVKEANEFKGLTNKIDGVEEQIKIKEDRISELEDEIAELRAQDPPDTDAIADKRQRKKDRIADKRRLRQERRELFAQLTAKVIEEGLYDERKGTNLREERKKARRDREKIKTKRSKIASEVTRDYDAENALLAEWQGRYDETTAQIQEIEKRLRDKETFNDHFNVKCLAKVDEISYGTLTNCDIVNFSLKSKIFKRIAGRQSKYGETSSDGHKDADNGLRLRTAMFWVLYKETESNGDYIRVPAVFAIRKGVETDNYTDIRFVFNKRTKWSFKMEPIVDLSAELRTHNNGNDIDVIYLETKSYKNTQKKGEFSLKGSDGFIAYHGQDPLSTVDRLPPRNNNPAFVDEWGVFSMRSDTQITFSFDAGPEISLAAVTEQQREPFSDTLYGSMSMLGFNAYSGKGVQDLRSLSAFVLKGKKVRRVNADGSYDTTAMESTSYAPEIFFDTIVDEVNGIGAYANIAGVDMERLGKAKLFCKKNSYYMDCVIAEPQSWREFWTTVAPYSLLEFAKIGGKETLFPAVPFDVYGNITNEVSISALFNQGNILEGTYKEEFIDYGDNTEDLLATIIYRDTESDKSFPGNTSVQLRLADSNEAFCIRQSFDLSNYVSRRTQAIHYGMLLCQQRRHSKRAVEFKTFPTESPVEPGSYIYVQTDQNEWDNLRTGKVEQGGIINLPIAEPIQGGNFDALLYKGSAGVVKLSNIAINNNQSNSLIDYTDYLIVLGTAITSKRVFRVSEVAMEEEGEVSIKAMEHPCSEEDGKTISRIVQFDEQLFQID